MTTTAFARPAVAAPVHRTAILVIVLVAYCMVILDDSIVFAGVLAIRYLATQQPARGRSDLEKESRQSGNAPSEVDSIAVAVAVDELRVLVRVLDPDQAMYALSRLRATRPKRGRPS